MADNTDDPETPKSKINVDEFTSIRKVAIPEHMQSLSQSSANEDLDNLLDYSPLGVNFDSDDSHPFQEEPSLELSDFEGSKDLEDLNFVDDEETKPTHREHSDDPQIVDNLDAYGYGPKMPPTLSLIEFEALEKHYVHGGGKRTSPPRDKDLTEYLREQGVMYEDDFEDSSRSNDLKDQGVIGDSDDDGTIHGDDFDENGILSDITGEASVEDDYDEFGVMREPGQIRSYDNVIGRPASPVTGKPSSSVDGDSMDMMKFLQKTPKEHFEHKPLSLSQDTYNSDFMEPDDDRHDQTLPHNLSHDLSNITESSPDTSEHTKHTLSPSDESAKESGPEDDLDLRNTSAESINAISTISKQTFPDYSSLTEVTREEMISPDDGNNSDLNNTSETVINLSDLIESSFERDKEGNLAIGDYMNDAAVSGKSPISIGPPIKKSTPIKDKDGTVENGRNSPKSGRSSPQISGRLTPIKTGRTTPKSGRTTPKSGRTTPKSTPSNGKPPQGKTSNGRTTPSKNNKDAPPKSGRNTPSKNGRSTPTGKSGRTTPKASTGRATPNSKSGRITPSRIPVRRGSSSGRSTPSKYRSDDGSGDADIISELSSAVLTRYYTSDSPPSSQLDLLGSSSVCSTDWENMSDTSKRELTARLKKEESSRMQADDLVDQLQSDYDDLLQKYALAEVTIDQLRLGARVTLETNPPQPGQSSMGILSKALQPQTINMGTIGRASISPAPAIFSEAMRVDPLSSSRNTVNSAASKAGDIEDDDPVLAAVTSAESTEMGLRFQAKNIEDQMASFQALLSENQLSPEDQKDLFDRLKSQHEQLERDYLHAKKKKVPTATLR